MKRLIKSIFAAAAGLLIAAGAAQAHPHVWVTMTSTVLYAPDGTVTGVRHAWTFDDMFSTFATQGLESKQKGVFTREELQPLAEVNVTSLKEYDYFSYAKANGKKTPVHRSGRLPPRAQGLAADPALHSAAQGADEGAEPRRRGFRSGLLHRFRFCREGRRAPQGRARAAAGRASASSRKWARS